MRSDSVHPRRHGPGPARDGLHWKRKTERRIMIGPRVIAQFVDRFSIHFILNNLFIYLFYYYYLFIYAMRCYIILYNIIFILYYIILYYITLYYNTLHLHCIALHYIILHYITLHFVSFHFILLFVVYFCRFSLDVG